MATKDSPEQNPRPVRTGGRVRSEDARRAVLDAAAELLEAAGYGALTIEGVARHANVAKSTVYRWWKSKGALVMDAYTHTVVTRVPEPDTGTVAGDLTSFISDLYRISAYPLRGRALRGLMAEAQLDPAFAEHFRQWVQSRRTVVTRMLIAAIDRDELPADLDLEHATDLVFGPFWYRLLVGHAPLDPDQASSHVAQLLNGLRGS
ncbi:hypothetical protein AQI88_27970 [Streptomyces cellostaticus]|uniref:HTH tetR-type domain-containing protein n=1 Tax=Streptomyces cellostaticus TaxID=67285 RepID=A0A117PUU7_9ACTN|nr:TetR/AcrR family transcriptional regulator [Streptomyces cellostaticus]KUM93215.1 hypothetical protein AQI88_27970 [Streptomyces cellostaticus]GHI09531.1 TetR family transcriptional regulator [Streptomyces cellostaticus]